MLFKSIKADTKNQTPIKNRNPRKNMKYLLRNILISDFTNTKDSQEFINIVFDFRC